METVLMICTLHNMRESKQLQGRSFSCRGGWFMKALFNLICSVHHRVQGGRGEIGAV
jgi:hypothetical protein